MKYEEIIRVLKEETSFYKSDDDLFIQIICEYLQINELTICHPSYIHIVKSSRNDFINIESNIRIDLKNIKKFEILI